MENQFEILEALKGKKATIFKYSEMGFPHQMQCEILNVYRKDYAQYKDCINVEYKPKGKRTGYVWRIFYYQTFAVFSGHVDLNANPWVKESNTNGLIVRESLTCFSNDYLKNALASTTHKPLIVQDKETETA